MCWYWCWCAWISTLFQQPYKNGCIHCFHHKLKLQRDGICFFFFHHWQDLSWKWSRPFSTNSWKWRFHVWISISKKYRLFYIKCVPAFQLETLSLFMWAALFSIRLTEQCINYETMTEEHNERIDFNNWVSLFCMWCRPLCSLYF